MAALEVPRLQFVQQPILDDTHPRQVGQNLVELARGLAGVEGLLVHAENIGMTCPFLDRRTGEMRKPPRSRLSRSSPRILDAAAKRSRSR